MDSYSQQSPRTPSPKYQRSSSEHQRSHNGSLRRSTEEDSPATPASAVFSTSSHASSPVTPADGSSTPEEQNFKDTTKDQVRQRSLRLSGQLDGSPPEDSEPQILLFQHSGLFSGLTLGNSVGQGQWSNVYRAWVAEDPATSARADGYTQEETRVFAAKVAAGRFAVKPIRHEARILSYLTSKDRTSPHIVEFYGYDMQLNALVLEYLAPPQAVKLLPGIKESPSSLPAVAKGLVGGLDYLHRERVIHGDIKPDNIFLRRLTSNSSASDKSTAYSDAAPKGNSKHQVIWQPVYCDFSASRFDTPCSMPTESAGTYDYMAPELFSLCASESFPTTASDVYALGVTLIVAATGCSPYESASSSVARRVMSMQGTPLQFLSNDLRSWRMFKASALDSLIQGAITKRLEERWTASEWLSRMSAANVE